MASRTDNQSRPNTPLGRQVLIQIPSKHIIKFKSLKKNQNNDAAERVNHWT